MSSILDALNKAEEERTAAEEALVRGFEDLDIEGELTGRSPSNDGHQHGVAMTPLKVVGLSMGLIAVIALVSGAAAMVVLHLGDEPGPLPAEPTSVNPEPQVATGAPTGASAETRTLVRPALSTMSAESTDTEPSETSQIEATPEAESSLPAKEEGVSEEISSPVSATQERGSSPSQKLDSQSPDSGADAVAESNPPAPEIPASEVAPTGPEPPSEPVRSAPPVRVASATPSESEPVSPLPSEKASEPVPTYPDTAPSPEPAAQAPNGNDTPATPKRVASGEVDIMELPELTEAVRRRLGLPEITVNVVGRPSKYRPQPSAMINFNRVVLNEFIPGTNAKLIGVSLHGIGIAVGQERYFVPK
ncbi:MAG: hypothetical protein R6V12_08595 [Candidatus Hydrogenedentota bacterium]